MSSTMPISSLQRKLGSIVARLAEPTFITQRGKVKAVLLSIDAYNALLNKAEPASLAMGAAPAPPGDHLRPERG